MHQYQSNRFLNSLVYFATAINFPKKVSKGFL